MFHRRDDSLQFAARESVTGPPSLHALWGSGNLLSMSSCQEQERFCPWLEYVCMMGYHLLKPFGLKLPVKEAQERDPHISRNSVAYLNIVVCVDSTNL